MNNVVNKGNALASSLFSLFFAMLTISFQYYKMDCLSDIDLLQAGLILDDLK